MALVAVKDAMIAEVKFARVAKKLEVVAFVIVAFAKSTPLKLSVPTFKLEIVAEAIVVVEIVVVPVTDNVPVALIFPAIVLPFRVVEARDVEPVEIRVVRLALTMFPV